MPTQNDFLPFAASGGANVLTQADYAALTSLIANGFSAGLAPSAQLNKVWRQASIMASVLAQLVTTNTSQPVIDDGTTATILANLLNAIAGRLINVQMFTATGTYTPTAGTKSVVVEVVGGGGASGGTAATSSSTVAAGGSGGGGGYAKSRLTSGFAGVTVTVGSGGAPVAGGQGTSGGTSSFGSLLSATGGVGGQYGAAATPPLITGGGGGSGGQASGGTIMNVQGGGAIFNALLSQASGYAGGAGSTPHGVGGYGRTAIGAGYGPTQGYGGGAGCALAMGAAQPAYSGAYGAPGVVIIWEHA